VLSPSYLRRPESYDRLGDRGVSTHQQRFLASRLLVGASSTAPGKRLVVFTCFAPRSTVTQLVPCENDGRLLLGGFQTLVTLTLTLNRVIRHTVVHESSTSLYTVGNKKGTNLFLSVTLSKINGF